MSEIVVSNKTHILTDLFPKAIFWDVNPDKLSIEENKSFIIQRVLAWNMGEENFMKNLEKLYPIEDIKSFAIESRQILGNDNIQFIADRYNLNVEDFPKWIKNIEDYQGK